MAKLFGTDGIRGTMFQGLMTPETFLKLGQAVGQTLQTNGFGGTSVIIGRDTRRSGTMIEGAFSAGLASVGVNSQSVGVVPTPAVGFLVGQSDSALGAMITASHNPASDNGIKFFGTDGYKLNSQLQDEIEQRFANPNVSQIEDGFVSGSYALNNSGADEYLEHAKQCLADNTVLSGLRVCFDLSNGAAAGVAKQLFDSLDIKAEFVGDQPNGININANCGAVHPEALQFKVKDGDFDLGVAFDGDADRIILVDEAGKMIDGDQILGALGLSLSETGRLPSKTVVATIMSNLGLENLLSERGLKLERTAVGDRFVVQRMREINSNLGGEQSGHIILRDFVTTGDGLISSLALMEYLVRSERPASQVFSTFEPVPQVLINVRYGDIDPLTHPKVIAVQNEIEEQLKGQGRLVLRKSGTEPVIRVMTEATDKTLAKDTAEALAAAIGEAS